MRQRGQTLAALPVGGVNAGPAIIAHVNACPKVAGLLDKRAALSAAFHLQGPESQPLPLPVSPVDVVLREGDPVRQAALWKLQHQATALAIHPNALCSGREGEPMT